MGIRPRFDRLLARDNLARFYSWALIASLVLIADGYVLIRLSAHVGTYAALAATASTGLVGAFVAINSNRTIRRRMEENIADGAFPTADVQRLLVTFVATVLLIVPGFITDALGLLVALPPGRWIAAAIIRHRFRNELHRFYEHMRSQE